MAVMNRHENALARAEELAAVGQECSAFQLLHDAILSKHFQHSYTELEPIMNRYLELGVSLRKGRMLKEGLQAFRSATINVNIAGFESMTKSLVELCKSHLKENDVSSDAALEDLELDEGDYSPETLWANAISGFTCSQKQGTGSEREKIAPWLRFLWEILRVTIDLCRNNGRLEALYQQLVNDAVEFCRKYQRKAEFRRLSEILRYHLQLAVKHPNSMFELDVRADSSMQRQLSIRFVLLDLGLELELWQEAFRALEDIHGLYMHANKNPSEALLLGSEYYEKLCKMLSMTDNYLFLAAANVKLIESYKTEKRGDLQQVADNALLAALAIPKFRRFDPSYTLSAYDEQVKMERMTIFLGSQEVPDRVAILEDIRSNYLSLCSPTVVRLLECDNGEYSQVPEKLQKPLLLNFIFSRLDAAYNDAQVASIDLKDFAHPQVDIFQFIINLCRAGEFWGKFEENGKFVFNKALPKINETAILELDELNLNIHSCPFGQVADRILEKPRNPLQEERFQQIISTLDSIYETYKTRKAELEKQREEMCQKSHEREQELMRERAMRQQAEQEAERQRLAEDAARREKERMEKEMAEIRKKEAKMREEEQKRQAEALAARQNAERLVATLKRMDYFERACRKEEIPLLSSDYDQQKNVDREAYEERKRLIIENAMKRHEHDLGFKHTITLSDYERFKKAAEVRAEERYLNKLTENQIKLEQAKEARKQQVMEMRLEEIGRIKAREEAKRKELELINATRTPSDADQWRRSTPAPAISNTSAATGADEGIWRRVPCSSKSPAPSSAVLPVATASTKAGAYVPPSMRKQTSSN